MDRKRIEKGLKKDEWRILRKGRIKDSSNRRIFHSSFFSPFSIRWLSFSYPFAIHPFPILSRFSCLTSWSFSPSRLHSWICFYFFSSSSAEKDKFYRNVFYIAFTGYYRVLRKNVLLPHQYWWLWPFRKWSAVSVHSDLLRGLVVALLHIQGRGIGLNWGKAQFFCWTPCMRVALYTLRQLSMWLTPKLALRRWSPHL